MARVFVSHAGADTALARLLHRWVTEDGHDAFLDQDLRDGIVLGDAWAERLRERLRWADAVVCLITTAYTASTWCTAELVIALERGSRLLPVRGEPGATHPLVEVLQCADLAGGQEDARVRLAEALRRVDAAGGSGWPDDRPPYPGLRAFSTDQRRVFFGREHEVQQLAARLRAPGSRSEGAALLVVGPSGCGKSSLVRAGLLPVVADEPDVWALPALLPGTDPVDVLARELAHSGRDLRLAWTVAGLRRRLDSPHGLRDVADELLLAAPDGPRRLLLVIDQFEELLTQTPALVRARFAELLQGAISGPVQLVGTLRPEFLEQLLVDPELRSLPTRMHPVAPLSHEALRAVVEEPARLAGIDIDDGLAARLVADSGGGEALPLLAFTLGKLASGVGRGGRLLTDRYEQLGGVQGALVQQADAALADATGRTTRSPEEVVQGLLSLVTVDEQGHPTRWRVRRSELSSQAVREMDAFVARGLLTTDRENGDDVVSVAHEAFLSAWPPLVRAVAEASTALRARHGVELAAREWEETGRASERLWERGQLAAAVADTGARVLRRPGGAGGLATDRIELSETAREFLVRSIRRDRFRRGRITLVLSAFLVVALVGVLIAMIQSSVAEDSRKIAFARQLVAQADVARSDDPRRALRLAVAAEHVRPDVHARSNLFETITGTALTSTLDHQGWVTSVDVSPDGRTLATGTADHLVTLWDLADPERPMRLGAPLTGHDGYVYEVAFAPRSPVLATASADGSVRLWNVEDPNRPAPLGAPLTGHSDQVHSVAFSADGRMMATGGFDRRVLLWDVTDPAAPRLLGEPLTGHDDFVTAVAFSPVASVLASVGFDGKLLLWDVTDPQAPLRLGVPVIQDAAIWSLAFAPGGDIVATGTAAGAVTVWDVTDATLPRVVSRLDHDSDVYSLAFASNGRTLATAGADNTVGVWDLSDPARATKLRTLRGHTAETYSVTFAPGGRTLVSGGADDTALVWDLATPAMPRPGEPLPGAPVRALAIGPDGVLATVGRQALTGWDVADPVRVHPTGPPRIGFSDTVTSVSSGPDGLAAAGFDDGKVVLWDLREPARNDPVELRAAGPVQAVAVQPDGRALVVAGFRSADDGYVEVWDLTDRARPRHLTGSSTDHTGPVNAVAVTTDWRTLATVGDDRAVLLWDLTDPSGPHRLGSALTGHTDRIRAVAVAPDGRTLATGGDDRTVRLWDISDRTRPRPIEPPLQSPSGVGSLAWAPDGQTLVAGSTGGTVALWDAGEPEHLRPLGVPRPVDVPQPADARAVTAMAVTPDSRILATADSGGTVRLWDLGPLVELRAHLVERACAIAGRGIDRDEWDRLADGLPFEETCENPPPR